MTLKPINIYLLNDNKIHVVNFTLDAKDYQKLIKHVEVLDDLPVYIDDNEFCIEDNIDVIIDANKVCINDYAIEL